MNQVQTFEIRYGYARPLLSALGMGAGVSRIELTDTALHVRMGWAFRGDPAGRARRCRNA